MENCSPEMAKNLSNQIVLRRKLLDLSSHIKRAQIPVKEKTNLLRTCLSYGGDFDMIEFTQPLPMPLNPAVMCRGIIPKKCFVIKSAMQPMKLSFNAEIIQGNKTVTTEYDIMFKTGDDVR